MSRSNLNHEFRSLVDFGCQVEEKRGLKQSTVHKNTTSKHPHRSPMQLSLKERWYAKQWISSFWWYSQELLNGILSRKSRIGIAIRDSVRNIYMQHRHKIPMCRLNLVLWVARSSLCICRFLAGENLAGAADPGTLHDVPAKIQKSHRYLLSLRMPVVSFNALLYSQGLLNGILSRKSRIGRS